MQVERRKQGPRARVYYAFGAGLLPGDLIYEGKRPVCVVSWRTVAARRVPYIAIPLDPAHLKPLGDEQGDYLYEAPLPPPEERK